VIQGRLNDLSVVREICYQLLVWRGGIGQHDRTETAESVALGQSLDVEEMIDLVVTSERCEEQRQKDALRGE